VQRFRGAREIAVFGHRDQVPELAQRHVRPIGFPYRAHCKRVLDGESKSRDDRFVAQPDKPHERGASTLEKELPCCNRI
jgi:hypothetical protein